MIVKMLFGSHLYGTQTPSSDTDYKGVAMPSVRDIALGRVPGHVLHQSTGDQHSRNKSTDVDLEIFSLHRFIELALQGQTVAVDMLHAPESSILETSDTWKFIQANRQKFYSKNVKPLMGYAMKQAAKYGIKGSRVNTLDSVIKFLEKQPEDRSIGAVLTDFPFGDHAKLLHAEDIPLKEGLPRVDMIEVCGKKFHTTCFCGYVLLTLRSVFEKYGDRALKAAVNEGVDWKAVSHAFRAAYQVKELLQTGTITFPRPEAAFLIEVKTAKIDFREGLEKLEALLEEVTALESGSGLPDFPDREFWENFLFEHVHNLFLGEKNGR